MRPRTRADIGRRAGERAIKRLNPRRCHASRPVVFESRASGSLVGHLTNAANGSAIARKSSFLREKLGAQIFPAGIISLTIRCGRGACVRPFDAEGIAGGVLKIGAITACLQAWLLDSAPPASSV